MRPTDAVGGLLVGMSFVRHDVIVAVQEATCVILS